MESKAGSYLKGATILTAAGILSRLLGLFFKVPLYYLIGSYGNGIFYNVTNIYNLLLMVSTVGLPTAISKMISENAAVRDYQGVSRVFRIALYALFTVGILSSAFLMFGAQWIIDMTGWPQDSYWSIIAIAPAPLIISLCSLYRGYFQGFQIMNPTAVSQILEQIVRVALGLLLAFVGAKVMNDIGYGVAGSVFGATAGGLIALLVLFVQYNFFQKKQKKVFSRQNPNAKARPMSFYLKRLVYIAIPVTLTSAIVSLFSVVDSWIYIPRLAKAGIDAMTATDMVGDLGNAEILINIPLVISGNLAVATMPSITESFTLGNRKLLREKINLAIQLIIIVGLPCCVGMSVLSDGIFDLLFHGSEYGGSILRWYAFATMLMMASNTFQSALQGIDRFRLPLYSLGIGAIIRISSSWILLAIPQINIYGIVISNLLTFAFLTVANYLFLKHYTGVRLEMGLLVKLILSSAVMGLLVWLCYEGMLMILPRTVSLILAIIIGVAVYALMIVLTGSLTADILYAIPGSGKILPYYNRLRVALHRDPIEPEEARDEDTEELPRIEAPKAPRAPKAEESKLSSGFQKARENNRRYMLEEHRKVEKLLREREAENRTKRVRRPDANARQEDEHGKD